jgi:ferredoxin
MSESGAVMGSNAESLFEAFLNQHDDQSWRSIINELLPLIHEVDRAATQIWFSFFPLTLSRALQQAEDSERLARKLSLDGKYLLKDQIDSSHEFLYGHRHWPLVKAAVCELAASTVAQENLDLATQIRHTASGVASKAGIDTSLVIGITAIALMTLQQTGAEAFKQSPGTSREQSAKSPEQTLRQRARDDKQGLRSFLRPDKVFTITFNEGDPAAKFVLINTQHLTTAAANDKREYFSRDHRCVVGEGPIPVQCRSASCGTCWVGVLAGADKLSEVAGLEWRRIKEFGYIDTDEPQPLIRLACQAQAYGNVSIVIPPWNGVFGRFIRGEKSDLEEAFKQG